MLIRQPDCPWLALVLAVLACGCRKDHPKVPPPADAGVDAGRDAGVDASLDAAVVWPIHDVSYRLNDEIGSVVYVAWQQEVSGTSFVRYRFDDEDWRETPSQASEPGGHEQIVLGIPFATAFEVQVVVSEGAIDHESDVFEGTTGEFPQDMIRPELRAYDEASVEPSGKYLFGSTVRSNGAWNPAGSFWSYIVDRRGRLVWARRTPELHATIYVRVSVNEHDFLIDDNTYWFNFDASLSRVQRVKIDGSVVETYDTPGLHHPFTELPDGTIVWGATQSSSQESLEELGPDGQQRTIWDSAEWLAEVAPDRQECFQSNALFWDEVTDTFLFSSFCSFYIAQIGRDDGEVVRVFGGDLPGSYRVDPPEAALFWQHGVTFTSDRTLLSAMHVWSAENIGVLREYTIDDITKTMEQVWTWKDGAGTTTLYAGEAHRLPNGNTLLNYGTTPTIREVTPDGVIVWDLHWNIQSFVGRSVYIEDLYAFAP